MFDIFKRIGHFLWHIIIKREVISFRLQKKFKTYGKLACILNPIVEIDGCEYIEIGDNTKINKYVRLQCYKTNNQNSGKIQIGKNCYIGYRFTVLSGPEGVVEIGDDVLIASDVMISNENHGMNPESELSYSNQPLSVKNVSIGNGCWLGEKVCVLPGVNIGERTIIGAGSVVTRDIPPSCIAVGNPAKVIKKYNFETHRWDNVQ